MRATITIDAWNISCIPNVAAEIEELFLNKGYDVHNAECSNRNIITIDDNQTDDDDE